MRTKTLLIAAAALAAAVTSSQAQTVYSQNIVGYANTTLPGGAQNYFMGCNPLTTTNVADDVLGSALQPGDIIYTWTGSTYYSETFYGAGNGGPTNSAWQDQNGIWYVTGPVLAPGTGFFYENEQGGNETNTYTGTVVLSNSATMYGEAPYGPYNVVGSFVPIAATLDNTNFNLPLQPGDLIYIWTGSTYYSDTYIGVGNGGPTNSAWQDQNGIWSPSGPFVNVGQGFFYENEQGSDEVWTQNDSYINP